MVRHAVRDDEADRYNGVEGAALDEHRDDCPVDRTDSGLESYRSLEVPVVEEEPGGDD